MTTRIDDDTWVARCVACLVELDPELDPELALPVARDMCARQRWRELGPEHAAKTVFDFGTRPSPLADT
jgi:hypothetical protein